MCIVIFRKLSNVAERANSALYSSSLQQLLTQCLEPADTADNRFVFLKSYPALFLGKRRLLVL